MKDVRSLIQDQHGYGSLGAIGVYVFAVYEDGQPVAAYVWQPPPPGCAKAVCPQEPGGVLALSRMAAVPKASRRLKHISKPLRRQMLHEIDRTRWPVLVTYSDEGQGHTGYVYQCAGWTSTTRTKRKFYTDADGGRVSSYKNGGVRDTSLLDSGTTFLQRWEHRVVPNEAVPALMLSAGWRRYPIPGKVYRNGSPAYRWVQGLDK